MGINRGSGFDPQLCCLNFSSLHLRVSAFYLFTGVLVMVKIMYLIIFTQSGSAISSVNSTSHCTHGPGLPASPFHC